MGSNPGIPFQKKNPLQEILHRRCSGFPGNTFVGDRITITGTAYKTIDIFGEKPGNSSFYKSNPQGGYLNVGYKVSDNLHIEAGFGYSRVISAILSIPIIRVSAPPISILSLTDNKYLYFKLQEKKTTEHLEVQWFFYFYK